MRPRAWTTLLVTVALLGLTASPANAAFEWRPAHGISVEESNGEVPQVAIADDGTAVAVWRIRDPATPEEDPIYRVQAAVRPPGENFVVPGGFISDAGRSVGTHIRLKMNNDGDAIVVWEAKEREDTLGDDVISVRSAYMPAGGTFGADQVVQLDAAVDGPESFVEPEVGVDGDGNSTVIFHNPPAEEFNVSPQTEKESSLYKSMSRPAGAAATWGDIQDLIPHDFGTELEFNAWTETHGSLSVNEDGDRSAVFATQEFDTITHRQVVRSMVRDSDDATWFNDGGPHDPGPPDVEVTSTRTAWPPENGTVLGLEPIQAWTEASLLFAGYRNPPVEIATPAEGPEATGGAFVIDSVDDGLAVWQDGVELRGSYAPFSPGAFGAVNTLPVPGGVLGTARTRPDLATDDSGSAVTVFNQNTDLGGGDFVEQVYAAIRSPGGGSGFADPVPISPEGDLEEDEGTKKGTGPRVAMNSAGEAVAVWSRQDQATSDMVVEAALYVEVDDPENPPPPPPPPRPRPPAPSEIQLARPLGRDQATVLIANVTGPVSKLRWSFGSKGEPPLDAGTERSVRLRLPTRAFTATARIEAPDGSSRTIARSFTTLKPSEGSDATRVRDGLTRSDTPPVFAVGRKETLTGESSQCAPMQVWSGVQKISGCFKPVDDLVDIPNLERGAIHELGKALNLDETNRTLMQKATQLTDGYVAEGRALLNDQFPVIPANAADVVSLPQAKALISAKAELPVGGATYNPNDGFNLKLDPKKAAIALGKLPNPPKLPKIGGLEIVGDWDVDLEKQEFKIRASVVLPKSITKAGLQISNEVKLRATPERVIVDEVTIGPIDADVGGLKVRALKLQYKREPDEWLGEGKACIISGACFSMVPPDGRVVIRNGDLAFAGASLTFPLPGIPLFKGVFLEKVGFGVGLNPTRMLGSARIGVVRILAFDGRLVFAFPSDRTPFILDRDEVGHDFAPNLYGKAFTRPTVGVTGAALIKVPELGDITLGRAHVLYEYPGYVAFGGGFDLNLLEIAQLRGGLSGELDVDREIFNLHGNIESCVLNEFCGKAVANVSRGPNKAGGAGACVSLLGVSVGGGVQWRDLDDPFIWPIDGCKWSPFKLDVRASANARRAQAGGAYTVDVAGGAPSPVIKLLGQGGAPLVRVRRPGGGEFAAPDQVIAVSSDKQIRVMRFKGNRYAGPFTVVGFQNAAAGRYTIEPLPGSPAITGTARATDQPDAKVTGRVTGKGRRRVLRYNVRAREAQTVAFEEVQPNGATQTIGRTSRAGAGRIRFTSAPGRGRRRIVAQFELAGIPAERKVVTTFKPQSARLARAKRVRVKRRGGTLRVSWRRVPGATRYEVAATLSSRRLVFKTTRRTRVSLRVPRWFSGRVTVRAIDDVRQSAVAGRPRFKATRRQPSGFRRLFDCRLRMRTITCAVPKQRCGGLRPTITSVRGRPTRGTRGNDVILGTAGNDRINGGAGNDVICAAGGNDRVRGGGGDDRITGRTGNDVIIGGTGHDRIKGGKNDDQLIGGAGNDRIIGGAGRGRDRIDAGSGNDRIETRDDGPRDRVNCGPGRDVAKEDRQDRWAGCERVFVPR